MAGRPVTSSQPPVPRNVPGAITLTPIATPTHGPGGSFSIISSLRIAAAPDIAFATLLEHAAWPEWNRFVRRVTILSAPPPAPFAPAAAGSALAAAIARDDGARYIKEGTAMVFDVHLDPDGAGGRPTAQAMVVTRLEPFGGAQGWRVAWRATTLPAALLRAERVQEFVDDGAGGTEYTCWETMGGPLAPVVRWTTGARLQRGFAAWGVDLKARAEQVASAGGLQGAAAA